MPAENTIKQIRKADMRNCIITLFRFGIPEIVQCLYKNISTYSPPPSPRRGRRKLYTFLILPPSGERGDYYILDINW